VPTITRRHASSPRGCRKTDPELGAPARFTDAQALVAYVGFYPVITESDQRVGTPRLSAVGSRLARQAPVRRSAEWRTIYLRKRAQGNRPSRRSSWWPSSSFTPSTP
jgi:transposase